MGFQGNAAFGLAQTLGGDPAAANVSQNETTNKIAAGDISETATDNLPGIGPVVKQADGSYIAVGGPMAGVKVNADGQVDNASLLNVQAIAKAQAQPGGLTQQGFTYFPKPDGTLQITGPPNSPDGHPNVMLGNVVQKDGSITKADGTPFPQGGVAGNPQQWMARTPAGDPASANPDFKGDNVLYNKNGTGLVQTIPGEKTVEDTATKLLNGLKDAASPGAPIDTSNADAETNRANALADALGGQAGTAGAQADTDRGLGAQTRAQQQDSIAGLTAAANGTAPSAAELQLKQQSGIDAARQYGLAAALQGNNPGAALRQASIGAAQVAGTTNQNAGVLRANEQATARGQLASTLANVRQGDQSSVNTDVTQQGQLTQGQLTSQGQGVTSTGQKLTAETEKEKADAARAGALIGAGGTAAATLLSDKRAKKDIVKTDLADALAKGVHGVTFVYRPETEEDDAPHFGVLADALEKVVPGVVSKGARGLKEVNTGHLTMANTGMLSELARRLQDLEKGARK